MIDSNETLSYQNGRESGYDDGYRDGVVEFAKYLKSNSFLCDSNDSFSFQAINVEDDLDDLVKDFLETIGDVMKLYEVVCTSGYLDIGLCIEKDENLNPIKVLARAHTYGMSEYGGVESVSWIKTGVYLIKDDWKSISYNKSTDQILQKLKILKIIKTEEEIKEDNNMTTVRDVVDNRAYNKKYNIEWYLDNGQVQTTSAVMTSIENGYMYFKYPSGGIFVIKDYVIRSLQCLED